MPLAADAGYLSVIVSGSIDGVAQARSVTLSLRSAAARTRRTERRGDRRRDADRIAGAREPLTAPINES